MNRCACFVVVIMFAWSGVAWAYAPNAHAGLLALGGTRGTEPRPTPSGLDDDRAVLATIVMNAVTEIRLCAFALNKTGTTEIRSLCRSASSDSARTAAAGMQLAKAIGATQARLEPAAALPGLVDALAPLSGHEFDRAFLLSQIDRAEEDEHNIRYAMEVASESALKRYEGAVLSAVERHLDSAEAALTRITESAP